ncbi:AI-2E family transporter [Patescibacteria group bacterium]|nr:AI-2E family transporter [Patescibacteria group bacterium]MBU2219772.1 AI-2E family transporter [Patescibacteria group bacterium]
MDNLKMQSNFLLILLVGAGILAALVLWPFVYVLILALIFAVVCWPLHRQALKLVGQRPGLAALLTTLLAVIFILTPLFLMGGQIFIEARQLYLSLTANSGREVILNLFQNATDKIQQIFPEIENLSLNFDQYLKQGATWLVHNLGAIFSNLAGILLNFFLFLIVFYFLLKDGQKLKKIVLAVSPLSGAENEAILNKLELTINSVVRGNLAIALIQGVLASTGLTIFGVPNPVLWGMVAAVCALIPGFGTSLVVLPAVAYLFLTGQITQAIGLLIWGLVVVGLIDNFLGPRLVGRGMKLHPVLVILSVLGGAAFFGPIGFLLGPLVLSLFFALFDIYSCLVKKA